MNRYHRGFALFLALCFLVVGCMSGKNEEPKDVDDGKEEAPVIKDIGRRLSVDETTLNVGVSSIQGVINPLYAQTEGDKAASYLAFLPLLARNRDLSLNLHRSLLESIENQEGKLRCTLKDNVRWWDDTPVTSYDVLFSLQLILSPYYQGEYLKGALFELEGAKDFWARKAEGIKGFEIEDDKHFTLHFKRLSSAVYEALEFRPIPAHYYQRAYLHEIYDLHSTPMGNGPYTIEKYEEGQYVHLRRNDFYFRGKPVIEDIYLRDLRQEDIINELELGELDFISFYPEGLMVDTDILKENYDSYTTIENRVINLQLGSSGVLYDVNLRRYLLSLFHGLSQDFGVSVHRSNRDISFVNRFGSEPFETPVVQEDAVEGLERREDGLYLQGEPLKIYLYTTGENFLRPIVEYVSHRWTEAGIRVEVVEKNQYLLEDALIEGANVGENMAILSIHNHGIRPDFTKNFSGLARGRFLGLHYETFNAFLADTIMEEEQDSAKIQYAELTKFLHESGYILSFGSPKSKTYVRKNLKNIQQTEFFNWYEGDVGNIHWKVEKNQKEVP